MPFVKIDETVENKFPCLECKTLCAGYWYISRHGVKRPYPFCEQCFEKGMQGLPQKRKDT